MKNIDLIRSAEAKAMKGEYIGKDAVLALLSINPLSEDCSALGEAARRVASEFCDDTAIVGSSIGLDLMPCSMSCRFCSLGEKWGIYKENYVMPDDDVIELIRDSVEHGFTKFTLRTTEFYDIDTLCRLKKRISNEVPGEYVITANTGELNPEKAKKLKDAGFAGIYHAIRLREGIDTPIPADVRIATIKAAQEAGLFVASGVDPIGIEHTNEEIADLIDLYRRLEPNAVCTMKRINVKGTPVGDLEEIDDMRLAQIAAVIRLAGAGVWKNVAVHPITEQAVRWGVNNVSPELGANPRDDKYEGKEWSTGGRERAIKIFQENGYKVKSAFEYAKKD